MTGSGDDTPVLFFDGVCNLCSGAVTFVIRHDKKKRFRFAPLQSQKGRAMLEKIKAVEGSVPDSLVLWYQGRYYLKSAAALKTAALLGGWLSIPAALVIVPRFIRDKVYDIISKRRYSWFGRKDACMIPTPDLKSRFLE